MDELVTKDNIYYRDLARSIANTRVQPIAAELDRIASIPERDQCPQGTGTDGRGYRTTAALARA